MRRVLLAFAVMGLSASGAAQAVGQSLSDTAAFVRGRIAAEGEISYAMSVHDRTDNSDWSNRMVVVATNVSVGSGNCGVVFHWRTSVDGKVSEDNDTGVSFGSVRFVDVTSMEDDTQHNIAQDHPSWLLHVTPPVWVVSVNQNDGARHALDFRDHDTAEAVAQAIRHGAELCR